MPFFHLFAGFREQGMADPGNLFLNSFFGHLLEARFLNRESDQRPECEAADVGPVRDAGRLARGAIENFREQPHRQQPVRSHLEPDETVNKQIAHLDFCRGETHEERAHQSGDGSRSANRRREASGVDHGMHLEREHARD